MSKKIYILRHVKAEQTENETEDFSRKITKKGKVQAQKLAKYFAKKKIKPDLILCSPAKRARQTLEILSSVTKKSQITFDEKIYEASPKNLLRVLQYIDNRYKSILLLGHNPAIMTLCAALANTGKSNIIDLKKMLNKFPAGGAACFDTDITSWEDLNIDTCELKKFIRPNKL